MRLFVSALMIAFGAAAHEGVEHVDHDFSQGEKLDNVRADLQVGLGEVQKDYDSNVKRIFDSKCADCHSKDKAPPWYSSIPVIHQIIESDRVEAQEHLEISNGFPFAGHGTIDEDIEDIKETVAKNSMPTRLYRLFHPASALTEIEKTAIIDWVTRSQKKMAK